MTFPNLPPGKQVAAHVWDDYDGIYLQIELGNDHAVLLSVKHDPDDSPTNVSLWVGDGEVGGGFQGISPKRWREWLDAAFGAHANR